MRKLDYIDALRGIAILGVLMVHTNQYGRAIESSIFEKIVGMGAKGVQLFYLASAFTLFMSFSSRSAKEIFPIRNFFIRRFFRIAPMYYIGICYYLFQDGLGSRYWLGDETHISALNILSNFTFLHGFYPYWITSIVPGGWSIGVEMTFYAVLPFLFSKIKNINQAFNFFIVSLFGNFLLHFFLSKFHIISSERLWDEYLFLYFPSQLPIFSIGIFMYFIIVQDNGIKNISGKSLLVFSLILLVQLVTGNQFILQNHIIFGLVFLIFGLALSKYRFKLIINPIVNYIGRISFSMYLVHFAVLHWLLFFNFINYFDNPTLNYCARFSIVTILTLLISAVLYNFIELPFQNIGKRIINKVEKKHKNIEVVYCDGLEL